MCTGCEEQFKATFYLVLFFFGQNPFGEVTTEDSVRFRIENQTFILAKDAEIELNFFIRYNQMGPIPDVVEVNFNGHNHCQQRRRRVLNEPAREEEHRRTTGWTISTTERATAWVKLDHTTERTVRSDNCLM